MEVLLIVALLASNIYLIGKVLKKPAENIRQLRPQIPKKHLLRHYRDLMTILSWVAVTMTWTGSTP